MTMNNTNSPWWVLPILLACVLAGVVGSRGLFHRSSGPIGPSDAPGGRISAAGHEKGWQPTQPVTEESVSLTNDFRNGVQRRFDTLPWQAEMTVLDLLETAVDFRPGITFRKVGEGEATFLISIDGLAADRPTQHFWQYWVNNERADRSCGIFRLQAGDRVLWKFAPQD